ncbi:MAG: hypothetical protein KGJ84_11730 [Elusimicrobia bacterium]|nr:hypothetical protein [Elusimicrobiota bacterium]
MKNDIFLALAFLTMVSPAAVRAQQTAAPAPAPAKFKETCPCTDYRFVPKTEKAKAVVAYWDARGKVNTASFIGTFAYLGAALSGHPTQSLNDAAQALGQAQTEKLQARDQAERLGGLKVEGAGEDAKVTITLKEGVDYTLDGR